MTDKPRLRVTTDGRVRVTDGFVNVAAGLGTDRDKSKHATYTYIPLDQYMLLNVYRQSWLARKIVDIIPADATRNWRTWHADEDVIGKIEEVERILQIQKKVKRGLTWSRLLGGSALYMSIDGQEPDQPLDLNKVGLGDLRSVTLLGRHQLHPEEIDQDPTSQNYGNPTIFRLNTTGTRATDIRIHPTRLVLFTGVDVPHSVHDWHWGDSVLQAMLDTVKHTDSFQANAASLVYEANVDVLTIPRLMEMMAEPGGDERVVEYLRLTARIKGNNGMLVLDGGDTSVPENASGGTKYDRKAVSFAGLSDLWDRMMQSASGGADIPITRLYGKSPGGLNSTGESDHNNYNQNVSSYQQNEVQPAMRLLDEAIIRSALGNRPDSIYYEWRSIYQETNLEKIERGKKTSEILKDLHGMNVLPEETLQAVTVSAMTETGALPGLEAAVEEHGLEKEDDDEEALAAALAKRPQAGQGAGDPTKPGTRLRVVNDAKPSTLYVRRDVVNAEDIIAHYSAQGVEGLYPADDLHVTVAYSRTAIDWFKVSEPWEDELKLAAGGPRAHEQFGATTSPVGVLLISASALRWRHDDFKRAGASWDHEDYAPHITLGAGINLSGVDPWTGPIVLGPEIWEEVNENWRSTITDGDMKRGARFCDEVAQPRHPKGQSNGGQFAPKTGGSGGGVSKDAIETAYYQLKKAGGNSWMTQKGLADLASGKAEADTPQKKVALEVVKMWSKEPADKVAESKKEFGDQFKKAIADQKAAAAAKKAAKEKAVEDAKSKLAEVQAKVNAPSASPKGLTPDKQAQLDAATAAIAKKHYNMQPDTVKKLASGEWKPDPKKPWQKKAVQEYLQAKNEALEGKTPSILKPKEGTLSTATNAASLGPVKELGKSDVSFTGVVSLNNAGNYDQYLKTTFIANHKTPQGDLIDRAYEPKITERQAVKTYTGSAAFSINANLRAGKAPTQEDFKRDNYIAAHSFKADQTLLRGVNAEGMRTIIDRAGGSLKVGQTISDPGYVSTTRSRTTAENFASNKYGNGYVFRINAPKGTKAAPVESFTKVKGEDEFLMPRGTSFKIKAIDTSTRVIEVDLVP